MAWILKCDELCQKYFGFKWPGWIKTFLWLSAASVLTYYAIRDVGLLQDDYYENNTATQTEVVQNQSITEPEMIMCVPYYSGALQQMADWLSRPDIRPKNQSCDYCEATKNHSWAFWKDDVVFAIDDICRGIYQKLFANKEVDLETLKIGNDALNWNQPIIDCIFRYFVTITFADFYGLGLDPKPLEDRYDIGDDGAIGKVTDNQTNQLYSSLIDAIGKYISRGAQFYENRTDSSDIELTTTGTLILSDKVCFSLTPNVPTEFILFKTWLTNKIPWHGLPGKFEIFSDFMTLNSLKNRAEAIFAAFVPDLSQYGNKVTVTMTTEKMILEERESRTDKCSREIDRARCIAKRQYNDTMEFCGCTPFSLRYYLNTNMTDGVSYCNTSHYLGCRQTLIQRLHEHMEHCGDKCQQIFYKWKNDNDPFKEDENRVAFSITYQRPKLPFVKFTLTEKTTASQYVSQLGGIINLYLGFSGFTVCAIIFVMLDVGKRWCRRGKEAQVQRQNDSPFSRLRLYWMARVFTMSSTKRGDTEEPQDYQQQNDWRSEFQKQQIAIAALQNQIAKLEAEIERGQLQRVPSSHHVKDTSL